MDFALALYTVENVVPDDGKVLFQSHRRTGNIGRSRRYRATCPSAGFDGMADPTLRVLRSATAKGDWPDSPPLAAPATAANPRIICQLPPLPRPWLAAISPRFDRLKMKARQIETAGLSDMVRKDRTIAKSFRSRPNLGQYDTRRIGVTDPLFLNLRFCPAFSPWARQVSDSAGKLVMLRRGKQG